MNTSIEETLEKLIKHADPSGDNYDRLKHYQKMVLNNVMLGPSSRAYIHRLHEMLDDIECEHISHDGKCKMLRNKKCPFATGGYSECKDYERARPVTKTHELIQLDTGDDHGDLD